MIVIIETLIEETVMGVVSIKSIITIVTGEE